MRVFALGLLVLVSALPPARVFSAEWTRRVVDAAGFVGKDASLALDAAGRPRVGYYDETNGDLKLARWTGADWTVETVDADGNVGRYASLALDALDREHISYYDQDRRDLKYARWTGAVWAVETVDAVGSVGSFTDVALDAAGRPVIGYHDESRADLKLARWTGVSWSTQTVDANGHVGLFVSLALDAAGRPHLSYFDLLNGALKYARWTGSTWFRETVDAQGVPGVFNSIALDASGDPQISYAVFESQDLRHARRHPTLGWIKETVASDGDVGDFNSLVLDAAGAPRIAYLGDTGNDLMYARWEGAEGWAIEAVDTVGKVGHYASMALDAMGVPHIAYHDAAQGHLNYATLLFVLTGTVDGASGGELAFDAPMDGLSVRLAAPAGAFSLPADISVRAEHAPPEDRGCAAPLAGAGTAVDIRSAAPRPGHAIGLTLRYRDADVAGRDESHLTIARYEPAGACWLALPTQVDPAANAARTAIGRFSLFRLMEARPPQVLSAVSVYPNPLRPAKGQDAMTFAGLPAGARVGVYSLSGDRVRDLRADETGTALWDGRNEAGAAAASGVYVARLEGGGERRQLKVMVQR